MELDLIGPRPLLLICAPVSTESRFFSAQRIQDVMVFFGIIIWRHSRAKLFSYVAWHSEKRRSSIHIFNLFSSWLPLVCCCFFVAFFHFKLTSHKTGNLFCIIFISLGFTLYTVHYPAEYLHLCCIPAVQSELRFHPAAEIWYDAWI